MEVGGLRNLALWGLAAIVAFLVTAVAFLLLANLGTQEPEQSLSPPQQAPEVQDPSLELALSEEELALLADDQNQPLVVTVSNIGEEELQNINLSLRVGSEDTSLNEARYYQASVEGLAPEEETDVIFNLDLSPFTTNSTLENPRRIIEIQATTPGGATAVSTAILSL